MRAKDGRCTALASQRVVHVARHFDLAFGKALVQASHVDAGQQRQRRTAARQFNALRIQQLHAQRLQHASAAVIGGAAANAQNQVAGTRIQRSDDQLTRAVAGGDVGIALCGWHQGQTAGRSHFDHGGAAVARQAVEAGDALAQRVRHFDFNLAALRGFDHGLHRAFAAIGHGHFDVLGVRKDFLESQLDLRGHFQRGQAFLVGIGGDHNFHDAVLPVQSMKALATQMQAKLTMPMTMVEVVNTRSESSISIWENLVTTQK